jgi:hypothetical protein
VLHLFTDLHADYHRSTDDWDKINAPGMVRVAEFATGIVTAIANRPVALTFIDVPPPTPKPGVASTPGYGAYLGTIPDMASGDIGGVRITGVTKGSPAELAGLKGGDIITRIGEHQVPDLVGMTDALRAHRAGDKVEIVVLRDGVERTADHARQALWMTRRSRRGEGGALCGRVRAQAGRQACRRWRRPRIRPASARTPRCISTCCDADSASDHSGRETEHAAFRRHVFSGTAVAGSGPEHR